MDPIDRRTVVAAAVALLVVALACGVFVWLVTGAVVPDPSPIRGG